MLDWDKITPSRRDDPGQDSTNDINQSVPACPGKNSTCPGSPGQGRTSNGAALGVIVPAVPAKKQRDGRETEENSAGGGVAANDFASEMKDLRLRRYPINPVAVALLLAYTEKVHALSEEVIALLESLLSLPPGEQVRKWWQACLNERLKPWHLIHLPTSGEGMECTGCSHIDLIDDRGQGGRGLFHWSCKLGYLIHETGRYAERILIAPPECHSFEQWRPGTL